MLSFTAVKEGQHFIVCHFSPFGFRMERCIGMVRAFIVAKYIPVASTVRFQQLDELLGLSFKEIVLSRTDKTLGKQLAIVFRTDDGSVILLTPSFFHVAVSQQADLALVDVEHSALESHSAHAKVLDVLRNTLAVKTVDNRTHGKKMA